MRRHPVHDLARHGYTFAPDIEARFRRDQRRQRVIVGVLITFILGAAIAAWRLW